MCNTRVIFLGVKYLLLLPFHLLSNQISPGSSDKNYLKSLNEVNRNVKSQKDQMEISMGKLVKEVDLLRIAKSRRMLG